MPDPSDRRQLAPRPWQPRFRLSTIFLFIFVCCVTAAGGNYLVQALRGGRVSQFAFILFTLASPLLLAVIVSLVYAVISYLARSNRD